MTWFRVGGGSGVPASLKSRMNAVLNKKFGTAVDYPPNEWPDDVDLLGLLEEKTVSGAIANILDGADQVPTKNVIVTIAPTQTGVSLVNATRIGKNLFNYEDVEAFNANVTITRNDGDYTIQNNNGYGVGAFRGISLHLKPSSYSLSLGEAITIPIRIYKNDAWFNNGINAGDTSCTFAVTEEADYTLSCTVPANSSLTIKKCQFEVGSTPTTYQRYTAPTVFSADLGRTIYGGTADIVTGEGVDENGNDFTFPGQQIETMLGVNNFWNDAGGDTSVTYRSSGTMTPVTPTLITKTITANGTYQAADDQADGYSEVVVNVPQPTPAVDPIMSLNVFVSKSGVSGTNTSTVARSFAMSAAGTLVFASGSYGFTNTGSNDGYFEIQKNGVSIVKQYCNTSTNTPISIPEISVEENDVVDLVVGFDNAHSNCNFQFYSAMVVLSEV